MSLGEAFCKLPCSCLEAIWNLHTLIAGGVLGFSKKECSLNWMGGPNCSGLSSKWNGSCAHEGHTTVCDNLLTLHELFEP